MEKLELEKQKQLDYIKSDVRKLEEAIKPTLLHFNNDFYVTVGVLINNLSFAGGVDEANKILEAIEKLCRYLGEDHHVTWSAFNTIKDLVDWSHEDVLIG